MDPGVWVEVLVTVLTFAVGGLVRWIWSLQSSLNDHKIAVARDYHSKAEIREVLSDLLEPLTKRLDQIQADLRHRN